MTTYDTTLKYIRLKLLAELEKKLYKILYVASYFHTSDFKAINYRTTVFPLTRP